MQRIQGNGLYLQEQPLTSQVSAIKMNAFFESAFSGDPKRIPKITLAEADHIIMEAKMDDTHLRPGGFVKGGITPMALTSNLNIDFLRPLQGDIVTVEGKMVKLGRSLAVIAVEIWGENPEKISSRATVTYALPQSR